MTRRVMALAAAAAVVLSLATGCAKPAFIYVAHQESKTYFKVPSDWTQVGTADTDDYFIEHIARVKRDTQIANEYGKAIWSVAYAAGPEPSDSAMLSVYPTVDPVVYSLVAPVPTAMQQVMSLNLMRDFFFPVSPEGRQAQADAEAAQAQAMGQPESAGGPDLELLTDDILTPAPGLRGVRVVYNYRLASGVLHTFDLTVLTNDSSTVAYVLLVRCTAVCYRQRAAELTGIVTSFTVRSQE